MIALDRTARLAVAGVALVLAAGTAGYLVGTMRSDAPPAATVDGREVLYWYDPMVPSQHFDKPGKSPFMDMQLVPKFADEAQAEGGVTIYQRRTQNLGLSTAFA